MSGVPGDQNLNHYLMGFLIVLAILAPIIFFILLLTILSRTNENKEILINISHRIKLLEKQAFENEVRKEENARASVVTDTKPAEPVKPVAEPGPVVIPEPTIKEEKIIIEDPELSQAAFEQKVKQQARMIVPAEREERDLEKFIGENIANKIGIAILVLGIGFFVKYAIDKNWINETGRVLIGFGAGLILLLFAHRIRVSYRSFSSVLVGGGLAVFYFTIAFAFQEYKLIGQTMAFASMIAVTVLAILLSLVYDRLEIAILAIVGGFITPFLLSTGQDNYQALFTYIAILNAGVMVLAGFKKWTALNFVALFATVLIVGLWFIDQKYLSREDLPVWPPLAFFTLFYLEFVLMNILHQFRHKRPFQALDFLSLLGVNGLFFAAGQILLADAGLPRGAGLFTCFLGLFNLLVLFWVLRKKEKDTGFVRLLTGLGISFLTLAFPIFFEGDGITLFWSVEALILFWIFQHSRSGLLLAATGVVLGLMLIGLFRDWALTYGDGTVHQAILFNRAGISTLIVSLCLFILQALQKNEANTYLTPGVRNIQVSLSLLVGAYLVLWVGGMAEFSFQFQPVSAEYSLDSIYIPLYSYGLASFVLIRYRAKVTGVLRLVLVAGGILMFILHVLGQYHLTLAILEKGLSKIHLLAHVAGFFLLGYLLYDFIGWLRSPLAETWQSYYRAFAWCIAGSVVLILSVEGYHWLLWIAHGPGEDIHYWYNLYTKAVLSILLGVLSFVFMWIGMRKRYRTLRIVSLYLFTVTLAKLFLYDIRNIPPGGKIAAFILLGLLLLVISFMYQRLKKVVMEE